ncbi:hypothetical protein PLCT1_01067 [Planctomycetaceae bacterium]|nr:hypothetical protein PLCT1_01067 [Planctomycetaceae bacterium]
MLTLALTLLLAAPPVASEGEYRPGGSAVAPVWTAFYAGDHEPDLPLPLVSAGKRMTVPICQAVAHKDMRLRRYAISALGYLGDRRALATLQRILESGDEVYYFRGDALHAIYRIDKPLGKRLAGQYRSVDGYLTMLADAIAKDAPWLTEPLHEE